MSERSLAEIVLFKLPIILEVESNMEADRPVDSCVDRYLIVV